MVNNNTLPKHKTIHIGNIELLKHLSKQELTKIFRQYFPRRRAPHVKQLMIASLSSHIQSQHLGHIDKVTQDRLSTSKQQLMSNHTPASNTPQPSTKIKRLIKPRITHHLQDGTVIKREFNGRLYEVRVRAQRNKTVFFFQDKQYNSLSKIAEEITGSHWSGPRFFGLTKLKPSSHSQQQVKTS